MSGKNNRHQKAYTIDIFRAIKKGKKRFFSLMLITILGVTMFSGLQAACEDLRVSADEFFDEQNLHDLEVLSTLGMTEEDLDSILLIEGVESAELALSVETDTQIGDAKSILEFRSFYENGMDIPYVEEGVLPRDVSEAAITKKMAADYQLNLGDKLIVSEEIDSEEDEENKASDFEKPYLELQQKEFTITAIVTDSLDINNPFGSVSFRIDSSKKDTVFVLAEAFNGNYATSVRIKVENSEALMSYTDEYDRLVDNVKNRINDEIKEARENSRTNQVIGEAQKNLDESKAEVEQEFKDAYDELLEAEEKYEDGKEQGIDEINDAQNKLNESVDLGKEELNQAQKQLDSEINAGILEIENGEAQIQETYNQLELIKSQLSDEQIRNIEFVLSQKSEELAAARELLEENQKDAQHQIDVGWTELKSQREDAQKQIDEGRSELETELDEARTEIDEGWEEYYTNQTEVEEKFEDAQLEIDDLREATWYIQNRGSISGYSNIASDADSIEAIGTAFPVVFFIVAILISLTTITRMVEEDRSLIGTYKSLGFSNQEIRRKYLVYAGTAGIAGSIIGSFFAFIVLPAFIFIVFDVMYLLPDYSFSFVPLNGILGPTIFIVGIIVAAALAVQSELKQVPASLMRPLAPKSGSRILLEKIKFIWNKLTFLQKVTARNLFRYKKRLFMTIFGIAGCTALMLFGFSIRDSVEDLSPRQYEQTFKFDIMAVADTDNTEPMFTYLDNELVEEYIGVFITASDLSNKDEKSTAVTLIVIPNQVDISEYISLKNKDLGALPLQDEDIYVTRNAANVLGLSSGDKAELQLADLQSSEITVTEITENYLGNYLYINERTYQKYFDDFAINSTLVHLNGLENEQIKYTDEFKNVDGMLSVTGIAELKSQFSGAFMLINMVVVIVIVMSAALAFVVLFTLAQTNISERARELATIKVLGFYNPEVHSYINRETMILTLIGIILGIPLGRLFSESLTVILNIPSIYLAVSLKLRSYIYAVILNFIFVLIVNIIIGRTMDEVDPVEALKSVE